MSEIQELDLLIDPDDPNPGILTVLEQIQPEWNLRSVKINVSNKYNLLFLQHIKNSAICYVLNWFIGFTSFSWNNNVTKNTEPEIWESRFNVNFLCVAPFQPMSDGLVNLMLKVEGGSEDDIIIIRIFYANVTYLDRDLEFQILQNLHKQHFIMPIYCR